MQARCVDWHSVMTMIGLHAVWISPSAFRLLLAIRVASASVDRVVAAALVNPVPDADMTSQVPAFTAEVRRQSAPVPYATILSMELP